MNVFLWCNLLHWPCLAVSVMHQSEVCTSVRLTSVRPSHIFLSFIGHAAYAQHDSPGGSMRRLHFGPTIRRTDTPVIHSSYFVIWHTLHANVSLAVFVGGGWRKGSMICVAWSLPSILTPLQPISRFFKFLTRCPDKEKRGFPVHPSWVRNRFSLLTF